MVDRAWSVRVAIIFTIVMLVFVGLPVGLQAQVTVNIAAVVGVLVSAAVLYLSLAVPPSEERINTALTELAALLEQSWGSRMALLLGRDYNTPSESRPLPASVKFARAPKLELDAPRTTSADGTWSTIYDGFYKGIYGGRLVIVGDPGCGKSLLAIQLVLQILRARRAGDPAADKLPVPVSVAGWDGADDLAAWLARRLKEEWHLTPVIGRTLVRRQLILPVLDGLDEIGIRNGRGNPPDEQRRVLRRLNMALGSDDPRYAPVIVTCRTDDYEQLKKVDGGLLGSAVAKVQLLDSDRIKEYLLARFDPARTLPSADGSQWLAFAAKLGGPAPSALETCLASPWYLSLAISACRAGPATVSGLESFQNIGELRGYLTASSIPAAVRLNPRAASAVDAVAGQPARDRRPSPLGGLHDPEDVRRWLTTLAVHLDWQASHGMPSNSIDLLTIWRLADANGGHPRVVHTVLGIIGGLLAGLLGGELASGTPGVLVMSVTMVIGVGFGLWAGLRPDARPSRVTLPRPSEARGQAVIALAVLTGILGGIGGELIGPGAAVGISEGVSASFAVLVLAGLGGRRVQALQPRDALRTDLAFGLALGVVYLALGGLPTGLTGGILSGLRLNHYLTVPGSIALALLLGLTAGITLGSRCWLRYAISTTTEATQHRIPLRLERFMNWAYGAGLLRITGVSYQFRHDMLRSSLAPPPP